MRTLRIKWDADGRPTLPEMSDALRVATPLVLLDYVAHLEAVVQSMSEYVDMPAGVLDALPHVWAAGYTTQEQDGLWHLFSPGGEGIIWADTFSGLCAAIVGWVANKDASESCEQPMLTPGQQRQHPDDYRHASGCPKDSGRLSEADWDEVAALFEHAAATYDERYTAGLHSEKARKQAAKWMRISAIKAKRYAVAAWAMDNRCNTKRDEQ